jgi:hypothetical protein
MRKAVMEHKSCVAYTMCNMPDMTLVTLIVFYDDDDADDAQLISIVNCCGWHIYVL